jgi:hypothetical protein
MERSYQNPIGFHTKTYVRILRAWEIVVWDWHEHTPKDCFITDCATKAYNAAYDHHGNLGQSGYLAAAINSYSTYEYIHLIGHSAGGKLIHEASNTLAEHKKREGGKRPFIHLTFLDAYTPDDSDTSISDKNTYGFLANYQEHYAEHYVDKSLKYTDSDLSHAYNFDITGWEPVSRWPNNPDEKESFGHQWPRYWYEHSVTSHWHEQYGFRYGYPLSLEGSGKDLNELVNELVNELGKYPANPADPSGRGCIKLNRVTETAKCN